MRAYESIQYEMEEKSIWRQKSGRANNSACPLGTKNGQAIARPAQYGPPPMDRNHFLHK